MYKHTSSPARRELLPRPLVFSISSTWFLWRDWFFTGVEVRGAIRVFVIPHAYLFGYGGFVAFLQFSHLLTSLELPMAVVRFLPATRRPVRVLARQ